MATLLEQLRGETRSREAAAEALALITTMYPICRSITGDGVRRTLDQVETWVALERTELPTGMALFDWEVPREWNIRAAFVKGPDGQPVIDFRESNLHVVSYSTPVHCSLTLEQLQPHLHSLPEQPDLIPYRTSYYRENWGFCLRHRDRVRLGPGPYEVLIDADLAPGHLTYGEAVIAGTPGEGEAIVYTHVCHPSLANDNLSGIAVAAALARELRRASPRLTWRFIFGPGTIGSLAWLARNEERLDRIRGGLVIGLLGDPGPLTYKRSRRGATATDRALAYALKLCSAQAKFTDFEPYGYDERQFCSPGFDLPIGRLTRSANGCYPQYHTSADDLSLLRPESLAESLRVLATAIELIDGNRRLVNLSPKGEPRLGKRGLYGDMGGSAPGQFEQALLWILSFSDREHDLLSIAERSGLEYGLLLRAGEALEKAGLARTAENHGMEGVFSGV
jgi:aminopeptidase-like protein